MTAKDNYSFEPLGTVDTATPVAKAVPTPTSNATAPESYYTEDVEQPSTTAIIVGCGIVGWMIAGPCLAILTALSGIYAAEKNKGPIGDSTRAIGRVAAAAGKKAREEHLLCKIKEAIGSIFTKKKCPHCGNSATNQGCAHAATN
ncbi:hypothetical protein ACHAWU_000510 [Discostella pseudostelligera]|uniref:Uncharacterized protein n=1 Tax=Discostella pseudostelligera TaxID=259834 RepID=A0ABD3M102_9STRA